MKTAVHAITEPIAEALHVRFNVISGDLIKAINIQNALNEVRRHCLGRWKDVQQIELLEGGTYLIRRVTYKELRVPKRPSLLVRAEEPLLAVWKGVCGWFPLTGTLYSTTSSYDSLQVLT